MLDVTRELDPQAAMINRTIRALLAIRDMRPDQLYMAMGMPKGTYYNRMRGDADWTALEVKRAADALNVSVATLFDGLSVAGAGFEPATSGLRAWNRPEAANPAFIGVRGVIEDHQPDALIIPFPRSVPNLERAS